MERKKKLVLLFFVEEQIGGAYTLRNESEKELFTEMLIGALQFCSLYMYILYIQQKFRTSLSKKIGVNTCFEDGQKVRNDD